MEGKQLASECRGLKTAGQSASVAAVFKPTCGRLDSNLEEKSHFGSKTVNDDDSLVRRLLPDLSEYHRPNGEQVVWKGQLMEIQIKERNQQPFLK